MKVRNMAKLDGKRALVSGGSRGIAAAIARRLAAGRATWGRAASW